MRFFIPLVVTLSSLAAAQTSPVGSGYANRLDVLGTRIEATEQVPTDWMYLTALTYERMTRALPEYRGLDIPEEVGGLGGDPGEPTIAVQSGQLHT